MLSLVLAATLAASSNAPSNGCTKVTTPFVGTICSPNDGKRHPAIIVLGGSEGGDSAAPMLPYFARRGYIGVSVAYFGLPGLPPTLVDVPVETIGHALDAISKRGDVDATRIGIMGTSRGGEFAYLAAATYPQIRAVVGIVPSPIRFMGLGVHNIPTRCAWTYRGKELPCVPPDAAAGQQIGVEIVHHEPVVLTPFYDASRNDDAAVTRAAFIALEKIHGPVLCLGGRADQMWNSSAQCGLTMEYLQAHHHPFADREYTYPDAGHLFMAAVAGPSSALESITEGPVTYAFGGTPQGNASAARDAVTRIWSFFDAALGN